MAIKKAKDDLKQFYEDTEGTDFWTPSGKFLALWFGLGMSIALLGRGVC